LLLTQTKRVMLESLAEFDHLNFSPAVRIYRPAGTWGSRSRIAPRARWFDAVVTA
jgi:hypothetical protein